MALSAGSSLGPFEILGPLGAGGMGEVYRARDTRLDRTVAIKVLPADLCGSPEARQRFEREARLISQLSHPHICALFDVGRQDEVDFLVMEYLEGTLLSDRLAKGALPLEQTLRYGVEMADALHKAHGHGIIHRDLKPANVMLTRSGIKLLDFGLAKTEPLIDSKGSLTSLPTRANLTQEGTILGTIQYMAPEQLEGREADARTDLFALGAVLYEMATGMKAFSGGSQASLISAIMKEEPPPIARVQPMAPPALEHTVKTCLAKDPEERWQSASDLKTQLKWIAEEGGRPGLAAAIPAPRKWRECLAWGLAAVALALAAAGFLAGRRQAPQPPRPARFSILLPGKSALRAVAIAPDGKKLVAVARDASGRNLLWIRSLESLALRPLEGTENPSFPFWSPDGRFLGFFADGKLKKIAVSGGPPQTLCDAPINRGGSWGQDGTILFAPVPDGPIFRVSSAGGAPAEATRFNAARGETSHRFPYFLPDGRHYLYLVANFAASGEQERMGIYAGSLDSKEETFLLRANSSSAYAPPGFLLFLRDRTLLAQAFDAEQLRITGEPLPLAEQVQYFPQVYAGLFSVSAEGTLVYQDRAASSIAQLVWFDRAGRQLAALGAPGDQANPRLSPDGRKVLVDITDPQTGNMDIWSYDTSGGIPTRLTTHPAIDGGAIWSPDGDRILFMSIRQGHADLYRKSSRGGGDEETVLKSGRTKYPNDWSPDGRFILFRTSDSKSNLELWTMPVGVDRVPVPFIKTGFAVSNGQFSPDGRFVSYSSNESGTREIYVAPFPGPGGNWKISSEGGSEPKWRRDGKELFYIGRDGRLMSVAIKEGPLFDADVAKPLFPIRRREPVSSTDSFSYDVSPDGQRFLVNADVGETASPPLTVVLDWTSELER
jgi:Tol biopolymer transport system component